MGNLTDAQLGTLRHMLGINTPWDREPKPFRNYYCANPGDPSLLELERLGAVRKYSERGSYHWYCCTEAGELAALRSHKDIRYSKAKRVYGKFLDISDCHSDLTFKEFITSPIYAESRRSA